MPGLDRRPPYHPAERFPALAGVQAEHRTIRDEANAALTELGAQLEKDPAESWILPLRPEDEDRHLFSDAVYDRARALAPVTTRLMRAIPYVIAYAFSKLAVGRHIGTHRHWNPYLTALLCLQGGTGCHLMVADERRDFQDGEVIVFDYRKPHSVENGGTIDRIALLMLIDPR
jgi:aspartyl/asparaginyl beta-hydroxylase (cupin superfamily)